MIWNYCLNLPTKNHKTKRFVFITINILISGLLGLLLSSVLRIILVDFKSLEWTICLIGYPMVIAYIASIIYLFKHEN